MFSLLAVKCVITLMLEINSIDVYTIIIIIISHNAICVQLQTFSWIQEYQCNSTFLILFLTPNTIVHIMCNRNYKQFVTFLFCSDMYNRNTCKFPQLHVENKPGLFFFSIEMYTASVYMKEKINKTKNTNITVIWRIRLQFSFIYIKEKAS